MVRIIRKSHHISSSATSSKLVVGLLCCIYLLNQNCYPVEAFQKSTSIPSVFFANNMKRNLGVTIDRRSMRDVTTIQNYPPVECGRQHHSSSSLQLALLLPPHQSSITTHHRRSTTSLQSSSLGGGGGGGEESPSPPPPPEQQLEPKVYSQRWIQLGYLSLLALLSDWVCFSVAACPSIFESTYPGHSAASLIDIFLFTNVASCFLVTDFVADYGLGKAIKWASVIMASGCLLRSGLPDVGVLLSTIQHTSTTTLADTTIFHPVSYPFFVTGTVLVGAAQPFFQCTPPMLSATWFGSDERATSTAVALNFNQIGIATAFLVGGSMSSNLPMYFSLITGVCIVLATGTQLQFQDKPPSPPSTSEIEKQLRGEEEPPFLESVQKLFATPGFSRPLTAFICSISITNIVGTFIDDVLCRGGIEDQFAIDLTGAGFELAILLGGIVVGGYVDRSKKYKEVTLLCLLSTIFLVLPLGLTDHALGKEPVLLILALLGLGVAAGPIQPINAELAVDVTYPSDETAVESVQQIGGNLVSALLVPVAELAAKQDYQLLPSVPTLASDVRGDVLLLMAVAVATYVLFQSFDAPLRRSMADCGDDGSCVLVATATGGENVVVDLGTTGTTMSAESSVMTPEQQELLDKLR